MTLRKPTIVIFDMDGTAVRHINPRLLHALEFLDNISYRLTKVFSWLFKRGRKGKIVPAWHKKRTQPRLLVHRAIHRFRRKPVEQIVEPCPGLYDVLELLEAHNIPLALVSNGLGEGYGHDILQKFDLEKYFKVSVFREDISQSKPDPEPLLMAMHNLGIGEGKGHVIWYIGDRRKDVLTALAARKATSAEVFPIAFGLNAAVAIMEKNLGASNIFTSFHDMYDQLKPMFEDGTQGT